MRSRDSASAQWNVHEHCSLVLPFRSIKQIEDSCSRHRVALRAIGSVRQRTEDVKERLGRGGGAAHPFIDLYFSA